MFLQSPTPAVYLFRPVIADGVTDAPRRGSPVASDGATLAVQLLEALRAGSKRRRE